MVTPFVGVWIETRLGISLSLLPHVTPFVGVWIETFCLKIKVEMMSVTPFVGVWIETLARLSVLSCSLSHPSWVCGLNPHTDKFYN